MITTQFTGVLTGVLSGVLTGLTGLNIACLRKLRHGEQYFSAQLALITGGADSEALRLRFDFCLQLWLSLSLDILVAHRGSLLLYVDRQISGRFLHWRPLWALES